MPQAPLAQRCQALGTTCLVLALLEMLDCVQKIATQLFSRTMIEGQRSLFPTKPHGPPMGAMLDAAQQMAARIAPWEIARNLPYLAASVMLLLIANRLRKGDLAALATARQWVFAAFGVIAVSLLIQIVAVVPATMDYQRSIVESLPATPGGKGAPPFDVKQMVSSMTVVGTLLGLVFGTAFMSAWPIVLFVWAGRLLREARAQAQAEQPQAEAPAQP
jgi:hypothetical protein